MRRPEAPARAASDSRAAPRQPAAVPGRLRGPGPGVRAGAVLRPRLAPRHPQQPRRRAGQHVRGVAHLRSTQGVDVFLELGRVCVRESDWKGGVCWNELV